MVSGKKNVSHKINKSKIVSRILIVVVVTCILRQLTALTAVSRDLLQVSTYDDAASKLVEINSVPKSIRKTNLSKGLEIEHKAKEESEIKSITTKATKKILSNEMNDGGDREYEDNIERAFVIICMGDSAIDSNYVERFVWSARKIGKFTGWIVLLTDAPEQRYAHLSRNWADVDNDKFTILRPEEKHYIRHYDHAPAMVFKQFKTYVLQYLSQDSRLDNVKLVYYLDVDIVFGNPVGPLFNDLEQKYQIGTNSTTTAQTNTGGNVAAKMWMFKGNSKKSKIQGGQMILDRSTSQPCLDRFRSLMDPKTSTIDQVHLMQMLSDQKLARKTEDYTSLKCEIVIMPQEEKHILFPSKTLIKDIADGKINDDDPIPVLNHIKNTGGDLKKSSPEDIEAYLRYLFRFETDQKDTLGITTKTYLDGGQREKGKKEQHQEKSEVKSAEEKKSDVPRSNHDEETTQESEDSSNVLFRSSQNDDNWKNVSPNELVTTLADLSNSTEIVSSRAKRRRRRGYRDKKGKKEKETYEDDIERAMFVISMGEKAAKMNTVERFVYSAREIGKFSGWIVVLTDAPSDRYANMNNWTEKVIFMDPKKEDTKTHYKVSNMVYKRFKTYAIEYMNRDMRLEQVELVYYLDVDIVFGSDLGPAFHGIEKTYGIGRLGVNTTANVTDSIARGKMWMFKGNSGKWQIQGGQMVLDRSLSQPCLERWREGFDQKKVTDYAKDQYLLMAMKSEQEQAMNRTMNSTDPDLDVDLACEIVTMEQAPYIDFPLVTTIKQRSKVLRKHPKRKFHYSPMVHVRNDGGTANMRDGNIRPYMRSLLRFKKDQPDPLKILKKVHMDTT
ncbi:unnamed protein product [Pseudo-nitzschia multistriata]|uniref:Nucleotide-diphospho-sugar transferase domain-containing protein n=1 Tax=Pseudo-nitzschia multistriata TaxID=183589 RepID=A0A448YWG5_9STRA|nr:unnamed protein product [Pseudo-nitzschia multistriata]